VFSESIGMFQIIQPGVQQHVLAIRRRPVGKRHSRSQRRYKCPDSDWQQRNETCRNRKSVYQGINLFGFG